MVTTMRYNRGVLRRNKACLKYSPRVSLRADTLPHVLKQSRERERCEGEPFPQQQVRLAPRDGNPSPWIIGILRWLFVEKLRHRLLPSVSHLLSGFERRHLQADNCTISKYTPSLSLWAPGQCNTHPMSQSNTHRISQLQAS